VHAFPLRQPHELEHEQAAPHGQVPVKDSPQPQPHPSPLPHSPPEHPHFTVTPLLHEQQAQQAHLHEHLQLELQRHEPIEHVQPHLPSLQLDGDVQVQISQQTDAIVNNEVIGVHN
jgi:hypothetical protein